MRNSTERSVDLKPIKYDSDYVASLRAGRIKADIYIQATPQAQAAEREPRMITKSAAA